jgi:hypothetical protein
MCLVSYALCHEDIYGPGTALPFLTSMPDGGEWSPSRPRRFNPEERAPGTHWIGGRLGSRIGLDAVDSKILRCRESNPGRPVHSLSLYRLSGAF